MFLLKRVLLNKKGIPSSFPLYLFSSSEFFSNQIYNQFELIKSAEVKNGISISQINQIKDSVSFLQQCHPFSLAMNSVIESIYEATSLESNSQTDSNREISNSVPIDSEQLLGQILENRIRSLKESAKIEKNPQSILILLDLLRFSVQFNTFNQSLAKGFHESINMWAIKHVSKNEIFLEELCEGIINGLISVLNLSNLRQERTQKYQLLFELTLSNLIRLIIKNNGVLIDQKIELLKAIKDSRNSTLEQKGIAISKQSSDKQSSIKDEFISSQFFEFWVENESQEVYQQGSGKLDPSVNPYDSSFESLICQLKDNILDSILFKNQCRNSSSVLQFTQIFQRNEIEQIAVESQIVQCRNFVEEEGFILKFLQQANKIKLFEHQLEKKSSLYNQLYSLIQLPNKSNKSSIEYYLQILAIFSESRVVSNKLLKEIEFKLNENNLIQQASLKSFCDIFLRFYGKYPLHMDPILRNQVNFYIQAHFNESSSLQKLSICQNLLKLENRPTVSTIQELAMKPTFSTIENISSVVNFIIQFNAQGNKSLIERIQFYFIIKTFFPDQQTSISSQSIGFLEDLRKGFIHASSSKVSLLQTEILDGLLASDKLENPKESQRKVHSIETEALLGDVHSVDLLINGNISLEVNGFSHYFFISGIEKNEAKTLQEIHVDTVLDEGTLEETLVVETRNTSIKSALIEHSLSLKSKSIPLSLYNKYKQNNKHQQFIYEACFSKLPIQQITKIM